MINKYLKRYTHEETQSLSNRLLTEGIQYFGRDYIYLKRSDAVSNVILGDGIVKNFDEMGVIEAYTKDNKGFGGLQNVFSGIDVVIDNSTELFVSKDRWDTEFNEEPVVGSLLKDSVTNSLFEITSCPIDAVEDFYHHGKPRSYKLYCKLFVNDGQDVPDEDLSIEDNIDNNIISDMAESINATIKRGK